MEPIHGCTFPLLARGSPLTVYGRLPYTSLPNGSSLEEFEKKFLDSFLPNPAKSRY